MPGAALDAESRAPQPAFLALPEAQRSDAGARRWGHRAGCPPRLPVVAIILEWHEVLLELAVRLLQPPAQLLEAAAERRLERRVLRVHARTALRSAFAVAVLAPSPPPAPCTRASGALGRDRAGGGAEAGSWGGGEHRVSAPPRHPRPGLPPACQGTHPGEGGPALDRQPPSVALAGPGTEKRNWKRS